MVLIIRDIQEYVHVCGILLVLQQYWLRFLKIQCCLNSIILSCRYLLVSSVNHGSHFFCYRIRFVIILWMYVFCLHLNGKIYISVKSGAHLQSECFKILMWFIRNHFKSHWNSFHKIVILIPETLQHFISKIMCVCCCGEKLLSSHECICEHFIQWLPWLFHFRCWKRPW